MRVVRVLPLLLCLAAAALARADKVQLDKPVPISTVKADRKPLDGKLVAYDEEGFDLVRGKDKTVRVKWSELAAPGVYNVTSTIVGPKAGAEDWMWVGRTMMGVKDGEPFADKAFARAVKIDPDLQKTVDELKEAAKKPQVVAEAPRRAEADDMSASSAGGPQVVGKAQAGPWPPQSGEQRAKRIEELKKFAEQSADRLKRPLALQETKYFLFYSDLPPQEASNWAGLLDRMYAKLAGLFGVEQAARRPGSVSSRGEFANVWDGKALVFVFQKPEDYRRFQQVCHNTDAGTSAGMCHCYGDGKVHIAFYRQADQLTFAHVLVHESVHGFVHRFRSPATVPSWTNEGLAEVIATELVPRPGRPKERELTARQSLQMRGNLNGGLGNLFEARHIEGWQYPVAETLCAFMIQQSKARYVDFIMGIKDGLTWEQSLEQRYKAPRDRLVAAYRQSLGLKN
jgi:hypothetical protein